MALDKRFYKRFNFSSVPMEEYEVRDVARRSAAPDLKIEMRVESPVVFPAVGIGMYLTNTASEPAMHAMIRLFVDASLTILMAEGLTLNRDLAEYIVRRRPEARTGFAFALGRASKAANLGNGVASVDG